MSVWDTFSASLHMVQEKLEQVLEDTPTEQEEEEVGKGKVGLWNGVCVCVCVCVWCVWRVCVYMCMH